MDNNVTVYLLLLAINAVVGYTLGFIADTILMTINASGSVMNNQMGLSAAIGADPSTRQQVTGIEAVRVHCPYGFYLSGAYLLIDALHRSFDIFLCTSLTRTWPAKLVKNTG
ncbi:MAG: flagellar biosynthetic protein FliR [Vampirovibrionales bacterium]